MNLIRIKKTVKVLITRVVEDDILALASQLAYSFILAFFPFLIFIMTLVGASSIKSEDVLAMLEGILPYDVFKLVRNTVHEVVDTSSIKLLSISILMVIWSSSSGFKAVMKAFNKAYRREENRSFLKIQFVSGLATLTLAFTVILSAALLVFGEVNGRMIAGWFGFTKDFEIIWDIVRYLVIIIMMVAVFAGLYKFTPCKRTSWKQVFPGAMFAASGWLICSLIFSLYIKSFGNFSRFYGSIGAVIIFLLWLFIISLLLLLGGEINAIFCLD